MAEPASAAAVGEALAAVAPPAGKVHGVITIGVLRAKHLVAKDYDGLPDAYVKVFFCGQETKTSIQPNKSDPEWNDHLSFEWPTGVAPHYLCVEVWDDNQYNAHELLGSVMVPLGRAQRYRETAWFPLGRVKKERVSGSILLELFICNPNAVPDQVYTRFRSLCKRKCLNLPLQGCSSSGDDTILGPTAGATPAVAAPEALLEDGEDVSVYDDEAGLPISGDTGNSEAECDPEKTPVHTIPQCGFEGEEEETETETETEPDDDTDGGRGSRSAAKAVAKQRPKPKSRPKAVATGGNESVQDAGHFTPRQQGQGQEQGQQMQNVNGRDANDSGEPQDSDTGSSDGRGSSTQTPSGQVVSLDSTQESEVSDDESFVRVDKTEVASLGRDRVMSMRSDDPHLFTASSVRAAAKPAAEGTVPGHREQIELFIPNIIFSMGHARTVADLYLTDFRLVLACDTHDHVHSSSGSEESSAAEDYGDSSDDDSDNYHHHFHRNSEQMRLHSYFDLTTQVPFAQLLEVKFSDDLKHHVAHRVGQEATATNQQQAQANAVAVTLVCRDFRTITLTFSKRPSGSAADAIEIAARALFQRLVYLQSNSNDHVPAFRFGAQGRPEDWMRYDPTAEFKRQGVSNVDHMAEEGGDLSQWRQCHLNANYELCDSYPSLLYVPRCLDDETIRGSVAFRSRGRFPVMCWYNRRRGNAMMRCAQPKVGATGRRSQADEDLVHAARQSCPSASTLLIFDARSSLAAGGNKLMGKGSELPASYSDTKLYYMEIANIHGVRASYDALRDLVEYGSEERWFSKLEETGWLKHIRAVLSAACVIARKMDRGVACIVHCSDGWDRTSQLTSLAQLFLDPYFRTLDGFLVLIEKEWLSFGHMFRTRCGSPEHPQERSPIFIQFLDCVWQTMQQFPSCFEFTPQLLVHLADFAMCGWFGTFLFDCERQRRLNKLSETTTSVWSAIEAIRSDVLHSEYCPDGPAAIIPRSSMNRLVLWTDFYLRYDQDVARKTDDPDAEPIEDGDGLRHNVVVWVLDEHARTCWDCGLSFTLLRRRHHCRACGHVFCDDCSKNRVPLPAFGYSTDQRACDSCYHKYKPPSTKEPVYQPSIDQGDGVE